MQFYSKTDIDWINTVLSDLSHGYHASEIDLPDGSRTIRLSIGNLTKDFKDPTEVVNYTIGLEKERIERSHFARTIIICALSGAIAARASKSDVLAGMSIGTIVALLSQIVGVK